MLKLDLNVYYSNDLSSIYFEDFQNNNDILFFNGYCVIFNNGSGDKPYFKKSILAKMKKSDLAELANDLELFHNAEDYTKAEIIEELLNVSNRKFYKYHYNAVCSYFDLDYDFTISGYSQGEAVKIKQVGGSVYSKDYLFNLFFDCPVSGSLIIYELIESESGFFDDCRKDEILELYIDELLSDSYEFNKNEFISNFKKLNLNNYSDKIHNIENKYNLILKDYIVNYMENNLREDLEYRG